MSDDRRLLQPDLPCHCLCGLMHPADPKGVCDGEGVTTRRLTSYTLGTIDMPLCAPCAIAQEMTSETMRG